MKTFLLTLIISVNVCAQINFQTQFPKIGYYDPFTTMMSPLYYGTSNPQNWQGYLDSSYYYPRLQQLDISHIVTFGGSLTWGTGDSTIGAIPFSSYNPSLNVLDLYFTFRLSRYNPIPRFIGGAYAAAQGNANNDEYYQVGGSTCTYDPINRYGFGTTSLTSVWVTNPPAIGNPSWPDGGNTVYFAAVDSNSPGNLLEAGVAQAFERGEEGERW